MSKESVKDVKGCVQLELKDGVLKCINIWTDADKNIPTIHPVLKDGKLVELNIYDDWAGK